MRGKLSQKPNDKRTSKNSTCKLSFELEVCWLPCPSSVRKKTRGMSAAAKSADLLQGAVVGIRRKRLRGDAWIYKNICEEVLAVAAPVVCSEV